VIALFNGAIPMTALQLDAIQFGGKLTLNFTKVLDEITLGVPEDQEELSEREIKDRPYWEIEVQPKRWELLTSVY